MKLKDKRICFSVTGESNWFNAGNRKPIKGPPYLVIDFTFAVLSTNQETGQLKASLKGSIEGGAPTGDTQGLVEVYTTFDTAW